MKFGELGTTQDWTPQNRKGPSILGGWSSHGPLSFKTSRNSAGLLWYNHLQILALEANKGRELLCLLFGDLDTGHGARCKIMNFCVKSFINCLNGENRVLFLFETEFNVNIFLKEMCETIKSESEVEFINECFVFYGSYGEMIDGVHTLDICNDILVLESEF